jgi:hypothetical protein
LLSAWDLVKLAFFFFSFDLVLESSEEGSEGLPGAGSSMTLLLVR